MSPGNDPTDPSSPAPEPEVTEPDLALDAAVGGDNSDEAQPAGLARAPVRSVSEAHLKSIVESLVFVSEKPIAASEIARVARAEAREVRKLLEELRTEYKGRGLQLDEVAGGWQFRSSAANAPFVRELLQAKPVKLTRAQVETLAIVAYKQPITRPEVDEVRGVDSGSALKLLLERELLRIMGRKDDVGRPVLYGTSPEFLRFFGLKSLKDLPPLREFTDLTPESKETLVAVLGEETTAPENVGEGSGEGSGEGEGEVAAQPAEETPGPAPDEALVPEANEGETAERDPAQD